MEIGNLQAFKEQQMGKVKMRAEEKKAKLDQLRSGLSSEKQSQNE